MLNNLKRHAPKAGKLIKVTLNILGPDAWLEVEHLGLTNLGFMNDKARGAGSDSVQSIGTRSGELSPAEREKNRIANRETVAKHSVRNLGGIYHDHPTLRDEDGDAVPDLSNPVASDAQGIYDVVMSLDDATFADLMMLVMNGDYFRPEKKRTEPVGEVAKKS